MISKTEADQKCSCSEIRAPHGGVNTGKVNTVTVDKVNTNEQLILGKLQSKQEQYKQHPVDIWETF